MGVDFIRGGRGGRRGSSRGFSRGGRGSGRIHTYRYAPEVDWICLEPACGTSNFARSKECQQCSASRPTQIAPRHEDWICTNTSCDNVNSSRFSVCQTCQAPRISKKPDIVSIVRNKNGKEVLVKGIDKWKCTYSDCGRLNASHRSKCQSCSKPHPCLSFDEIQNGLQLSVIYNNVPTLAESQKALPGLHSLTPSEDGSVHILLFTSMEALEDAKLKLEADQNVKSVCYMGVRSEEHQIGDPDSRTIKLYFLDPSISEEAIKKLDQNIVSVAMVKLSLKMCANVTYPTNTMALAGWKEFKKIIGKHGLSSVGVAKELILQASCIIYDETNKISRLALRDVPKVATLHEISKIFPDATSISMYDATFPASKYCHAVIGFSNNPQRAEEILDMKTLTVKGKKIYPVPLHASFVSNNTKLGENKPEDIPVEMKTLTIKGKTSAPPPKKIKLEIKEKESNDKGVEEIGKEQDLEAEGLSDDEEAGEEAGDDGSHDDDEEEGEEEEESG